MRPAEDPWGRQPQTRSACGNREAEEVLEEHRRDERRIALREVRVNPQAIDLVWELWRSRHSDLAITQMPCSCAARRRCQCPKAPRDAGSKRSERIDGAEHSAILKRVMTRRGPVRLRTRSRVTSGAVSSTLVFAGR